MAKPAQYFRAGAGAMIINDEGHVLAIERADIAGAWQLPQGGLNEDEEPLDAAYREIAEETGIEKADLEFLKAYPEPLVYELPREARRRKTGRGQALYWFLFHFLGSPQRAGMATRESRGSRWMPLAEVVDGATSFRKAMYTRLTHEFSDYLESRQGLR
ncbi:MAG TPA: RNA pyrophosphohydrolase [Vicinamibacterales bacterium]|nr:RNA pyrophosphohydrolase [Vicinamibacterales bacterium]